jgi:predicted MPP superfamily phosphohydrolase
MFFLVLMIVYIVVDLYSYFGFKSLFATKGNIKFFTIGYIAISLFVYYCFLKVSQGMQSGSIVRDSSTNFAIGIVFTFFITKMVFVLGMLLQDVGRLLVGSYQFLDNKLGNNDSLEQFLPNRRKFVTTASTLIAAIPFTTLLYGITKGKYKFTLSNISLAFNDLPKSFDGFKIIQISDIHAGSLDSKKEVIKAVDLINEQNPDLILFTGDLVNSKKDEINPFLEIFSELKAKHGKYAVLGNHDYYGLYDIEEKDHEPYWQDFYQKFDSMGFKLLNNSNESICIGDESIKILGVENWGAGRWFPKKGDLDQATVGVKNEDFSILMSHDPTHWEEQIKSYHNNIHLTLSGHTHGMQFGIDMPGFKWSPVKYRYKHWMGLYEEQGKFLYVNKGFGFLGFPGRVGMWPEISVFELKSLA